MKKITGIIASVIAAFSLSACIESECECAKVGGEIWDGGIKYEMQFESNAA